ncbi:PDDEXK family nuclease [Paraburkholderia bannensis]|uniref:hypothetical protein n=1 Tax=Paraburkholderia bannensis TaxID=765414 RepID=UPI002AB784A9|nr:hypothetical protein [Paraburkholderia bannensis]
MRLGDCSHLPFSRGEAERLRQEDEQATIKVPFDPAFPEDLRLRTLAGRPILTWPATLPERDPRGVLSAGRFECWKKASDSKVGIAGSYFTYKGAGRVAIHSHLEARLLTYFEMCPFVVEIRTQYPAWDREKYLSNCANEKRMRKTEIMTIDFMLRLYIPGHGFRYHGVSGKPSAFLKDDRVVRRHDREADNLWLWESTHEAMTEKTVPDIEYRNLRRLLASMRHTEDIGAYTLRAAELARELYATKARGPLSRVLRLMSNRFNRSTRSTYRIFAIAHFLGYLRWDHRYPLDARLPMMLMRGE